MTRNITPYSTALSFVVLATLTISGCKKHSDDNNEQPHTKPSPATQPPKKPVAATTSLSEAVGTWTVDAGHSVVLFRVKHIGVSYYHGRFNKVSGTLVLNADPAKSSVSIEVDPSSVFTASKDRDKHLKGPDFFNVKQFPKLTFKSTKVVAAGKRKFSVTGNLNMHGVSKSVTATFEHVGSGISPLDKKSKVTGFEGVFTVKRSDFGMTYGLPAVLGDEVRVTVAIEATDKK